MHLSSSLEKAFGISLFLFSDRIAPPPPQRSLSTKRTAPPKPDSNHRPSESAPAVKDEKVVEKVEISSVNDVCSSKSGFLQESTVKVPVQLGRELVAKVQTEGQLSEMKSRYAMCHTVCNFIANYFILLNHYCIIIYSYIKSDLYFYSTQNCKCRSSAYLHYYNHARKLIIKGLFKRKTARN